jgi:ribosome-binding protein aMBF1 (putative translation factor)
VVVLNPRARLKGSLFNTSKNNHGRNNMKKYQEGGDITDRSGLKSRLGASRRRTQLLMDDPEAALVSRDRTSIPIKPRSLFDTSPQSSPSSQRDREMARREEDFRSRVNRAIEQEYKSQSDLESKLEENQTQSRPKNYKKGGVVKKGSFAKTMVRGGGVEIKGKTKGRFV